MRNEDRTDILFLSEHAPWPMDQGFKVHGLSMARALRDGGRRVAFSSMSTLPTDAPLDLAWMYAAWPKPSARAQIDLRQAFGGPGNLMRRRWARYLLDEPAQLAGTIDLVDKLRPKVVIGVGLHSAIALQALRRARGVRCVWYGADELVRFHLSCIRREPVTALPGRLRQLAVHAGLERLFVRGLDGAIGVSPSDTRLLKWIAGARRAVTIRNGVALDRFTPAPGSIDERPKSLVFWGRMDFEPNHDAAGWFLQHVWPTLRERHPEATWRIVGANPPDRLRQHVAQTAGVALTGHVDDVRREAWSAALTVLPMRCGGGIKNKLLEAAAMARPIVASRRAVSGLVFDEEPPMRLCRSAEEWVAAIEQLWSDPAASTTLGGRARNWVRQRHNWRRQACGLAAWLDSLPPTASRRVHPEDQSVDIEERTREAPPTFRRAA